MIWSAMPALPPNTAPSPIVDAARDAGIAPPGSQLRPMRHVVADLHKVIDLGPLADHGVLEGAAVDAGLGADGDAVLQDHPPQLRQIDEAARADGRAEARLADHGAGQDLTRSPTRVQESVTLAPMTQPRPMATPGPMAALIADHRAAADPGRLPRPPRPRP